MAVLMMLASSPEEVVSRATILKAIWPDSPSADQALNRAISNLRRAFGDSPHSPSIIETIPGRGYRLIAECTHSSVKLALPSADSIPWRNKLPRAATIILGSVVVLAGGGVAFLAFDNYSKPAGSGESLRVLQSPFHVVYVAPTIVISDGALADVDKSAREIAGAIRTSLEQGDYVIIGTDEPVLTRTASIIEWSNRAYALGVTRMLGLEVFARQGVLSVHLYIWDTQFDKFLWQQTLYHSDPANIQPLLISIEQTLLDATSDFLSHPMEGDQASILQDVS